MVVREETTVLFTRPAYECKSHLRWAFCIIAILFNMTHKKNEAGNLLPMTVTDGVTVNVLTNPQHEYLMNTSEVALGYGTSKYVILKAYQNHPSEMIEGKHYVKGVDIFSTPHKKRVKNLPQAYRQPKAILFTKRGIIRLGFFIKSKQAKLFRDWAEDLIINLHEQRTLFSELAVVEPKKLPAKRKHNRLTAHRMVSIMADVCRIDDKELRLSITDKLMGGQA